MGPIVVYSVVLDWLDRVTAVTGWLLLWWWGRAAGRRGPLSPLWWAGCALVVAATLRTVPATLVLDQLTGQSWLSVLVAHLLTLGAALTVVTAQLATHATLRRRMRHVLWGITAATAAGLMTSWWVALQSGPWPSAVPFVPGSAPITVAAGVAAEVHQSLFGVVVLLAAATVGISVVRELTDTPAGPLRLLLGLSAAVAACAAAWGAVQAAAAIAPAWDGGVAADTLGILDLVLVTLAGVLGVAAVVVYRTSLQAIPQDPIRVRDDVMALRDWLVEPGAQGAGVEDLFGLLIEVRDRMWLLQQRVSSQQVERAGMVARSMGLVGDTSRAFTAAVALEVAMRNDAGLRPVRSADISRLGGGADEEQEALWLSQVQRCRATHPVDTAASWVLEHTPAGEMRPTTVPRASVAGAVPARPPRHGVALGSPL